VTAAGQGLGREVFELRVAACHGGLQTEGQGRRSVIANDRDDTTSGRWDGRQLTGQIDPDRVKTHRRSAVKQE